MISKLMIQNAARKSLFKGVYMHVPKCYAANAIGICKSDRQNLLRNDFFARYMNTHVNTEQVEVNEKENVATRWNAMMQHPTAFEAKDFIHIWRKSMNADFHTIVVDALQYLEKQFPDSVTAEIYEATAKELIQRNHVQVLDIFDKMKAKNDMSISAGMYELGIRANCVEKNAIKAYDFMQEMELQYGKGSCSMAIKSRVMYAFSRIRDKTMVMEIFDDIMQGNGGEWTSSGCGNIIAAFGEIGDLDGMFQVNPRLSICLFLQIAMILIILFSFTES